MKRYGITIVIIFARCEVYDFTGLHSRQDINKYNKVSQRSYFSKLQYIEGEGISTI